MARLMFVAGLLCVGWVYLEWADARTFQQSARLELAAEETGALPRAAAPVPAAAVEAPVSEAPRPAAGRDVIGLLDIPRVQLSVAVVEGDDRKALKVAVGHVLRTPFPWDAGNAVFAGHRDNFFQPLKSLRIGDDLRLTTHRGTFNYQVRDIRIVEPDDVWVLEPAEGIDLTLITCYPFRYVGPAPLRFVVRAGRVAGNVPVPE